MSVWVTAPPLDGRANEQVIKVLAAALNVRSSSIAIVGGAGGRWKWMQIMGTTEEELGRRLKALTANFQAAP